MFLERGGWIAKKGDEVSEEPRLERGKARRKTYPGGIGKLVPDDLRLVGDVQALEPE